MDSFLKISVVIYVVNFFFGVRFLWLGGYVGLGFICMSSG